MTIDLGGTPTKDAKDSPEDDKAGGDEAAGDGQRFVGTIKFFDELQGFGFITSPEIVKIYGRDVFFNQAVTGGPVTGGKVSFRVELNERNQPQARRIQLLKESTQENADKTELPPSMGLQRHIGRVKSWNARRGYGFIDCPDLAAFFGGRDVYVPKGKLSASELNVGQNVAFSLTTDPQGMPQARDVVIVSTPGARPGISGAQMMGMHHPAALPAPGAWQIPELGPSQMVH